MELVDKNPKIAIVNLKKHAKRCKRKYEHNQERKKTLGEKQMEHLQKKI